MTAIRFVKNMIKPTIKMLERKKRIRKKEGKINIKNLMLLRNKYNSIIKKVLEDINKNKGSSIPTPSVMIDDYVIASYNGDNLGKVFLKDGHIYRGIYKESVPFFKELWSSGLLQALSENGYIPKTKITKLYNKNYPIILEHEKVDISYSKTWNYEMIKDACIYMSLIQQICLLEGFRLLDGHLNNMTFYHGKPLFIDIGSFIKDDGDFTSYENGIVFTGLYKLIYELYGNSLMKTVQLYDEQNNLLWISPMIYDNFTFECKMYLKWFKKYNFFHHTPLANIIIFKLFNCFDIKPEYIELIFPSSINKVNNTDYDIEIKLIVDELTSFKDINSITDIGGNNALLCNELSSKNKYKIINIENDRLKSENNYLYFKSAGKPIDTYLLNILYGFDNVTKEVISSDAIIYLDLLNNYKCYQKCRIDSIINSISKITKRYFINSITFNELLDINYFEEALCKEMVIIKRIYLSDNKYIYISKKK